MAAPDLWVWIPNWDGKDGFQHYKDRDPIWIKNYTRLLSHDAYRALSMNRRGILHGIWLAYASSARRVRGDTLSMTRQLGQRVLSSDLISLCDAGFIEIVASTELAARYRSRAPAPSQEGEKEVEEEAKPLSSSTSLRSDETETPHQAVNGRAALDTPETGNDDIPLEPQRSMPTFPCDQCAQSFASWDERLTHLALDHAPDKEHA